MVLILDGSSRIEAHVCSGIDNSICLRHLFISTKVTNLKIGHQIPPQRVLPNRPMGQALEMLDTVVFY